MIGETLQNAVHCSFSSQKPYGRFWATDEAQRSAENLRALKKSPDIPKLP